MQQNRAGKIIRKQWQQVIIKSADKKGSGEELSKNKRGLYLVNIVSKAYEKVKKNTECNQTQQNVRYANSRQKKEISNGQHCDSKCNH